MHVLSNKCHEKTPSDIELTYFYKGVILFYEKEFAVDKLSFLLSEEQVRALLSYSNIDNSIIPENGVFPVPKMYKKQAKAFIILKKHVSGGEHSFLVSFIRHTRNSFAHGSFSKIEIDGITFLCLEDYSQKKRKPTMIAQLPLSKFYLLVEAIKGNVRTQN